MAHITQERLKELFDYSDGYFVRKVKSGKRGKIGDVMVGNDDNRGYKKLKIDSKTYKFHRLVWIWNYGDIADDLQIDHKNGIRTDNRIENLRLVTRQENQQNRKLHKKNISGMHGVTWNEKRKKWVVGIGHSKKLIFLGRFEDKNEAIEAYLKAKKELHLAQPKPRFL